MIENIDIIIESACGSISFKQKSRKAIQENYDCLRAAIKENGFTDFVAHQWTVFKLSEIFGPNKVYKSLGPSSK